MRLYRIAKTRFIHDLSGEGARLAGGRWNSIGVPILYSADSMALAVLEAFVHAPPRMTPTDLSVSILDLPVKAPIETLAARQLPDDWRSFPAPRSLAALGDAWAKRRETVGLRVPSVVLPESQERNVLLNPLAADFTKITFVEVKPFRSIYDYAIGFENSVVLSHNNADGFVSSSGPTDESSSRLR